MSDDIETLPVVKTEVLQDADAAKLKPYMCAPKSKQSFFQANKKYILILILFVILSIPVIDKLFELFTKSNMVTFMLKIVIFAVGILVITKMA